MFCADFMQNVHMMQIGSALNIIITNTSRAARKVKNFRSDADDTDTDTDADAGTLVFPESNRASSKNSA